MPSLEKLDQMLQKEPQDVFLNFARAMELARQNRGDEALQQFDRVIGLDAGYCPAFFQKGRTLVGLGRTADARAALQSGIAAAESVGDHHAAGEMNDLLQSL